MTATSSPARKQRITIVSAHEGADTWVSLLRFIGETGDYELRSFHQYDDRAYRSAKSTMQRLRLRLRTFLLFPLRFALNCRRLARDSDVLLVVTSPFFMPLLVSMLAVSRRTRVIVLMNDIYPEALIAKGILSRDGGMAKLMRRAFSRALSTADAVVFISERHREMVAVEMPFTSRSKVIPVSANSDPFVGHEPRLSTDRPRVTYCGTLGYMHDTSTFLAWMERYAGSSDVRFTFHTSGAAKKDFEASVRQRQSTIQTGAAIELADSLGEDAWTRTMLESHLGLVFQDAGAGAVIFPSKVASIMAAGQAVLAVADPQSDLGRLVASHECGWVVAPGSPEAFQESVLAIRDADELQRRRLNSFHAGHALFGKPAAAIRWIELFDELAAEHSAGRHVRRESAPA